jgi:hypothetical protein
MNFTGELLAVGRSWFESWSSHLIFHMVNLIIFCLPAPQSIVLNVTEFDLGPVFSTNYSETFIQGICWDQKNHDFAIGGFVVWMWRAGCIFIGAPKYLRALGCKLSKFLNLVLFTIKTFPWVKINDFYHLSQIPWLSPLRFSICIFLIEISVFLIHSALWFIAYFTYGLKLFPSTEFNCANSHRVLSCACFFNQLIPICHRYCTKL